ncbi:tetraspanin-15-like isoform X5 [Chroicocephalus ridibundus]|uniref:tetraspanin-15-like isoform X5 n=1 Tax=Chroicocephalus ridibundus TaxID=1192867 RepID=UPI002FDD1BBC
MAQASECRNSHLYYYSIKFALSTYATLFSASESHPVLPLQILGLVILCVGIYAEVERQKHKTLEGIFLAPAIILLLLGFTMFGVSFVGMVGSLRDNRTLLKTFFWVLLVIFLTELLLIFVEIIFENKMNAVFHANIQEGIRHYYDDLDFKNILDFVQEKFSCCGGDEYRDWEVNQYHSCNGSGPLACGVPYTCCIRKVHGEVINTLCGYRTLDKEKEQTREITSLPQTQHLNESRDASLRSGSSAWSCSMSSTCEAASTLSGSGSKTTLRPLWASFALCCFHR